MRRLAPLSILLLATVSCGAPDRAQQQSEDIRSYDVEESAAAPAQAPAGGQVRDLAAGPDVAPTAAPGVAFNYRYSFRLAPERIEQIQEQHAAACEQLGIARCRITGMRYRVVNARDIEGMLAFRLEPGIARRFGRAGVEAVVRADGMLTESEISGTDVGTSIRTTGRNIVELSEELRRLEGQLARRGLSAEERSRLEYEAQQLRQSIRASQASREEQQESLATTPMVFQYGSGDLVPGFDTRPNFGRALEQAGTNFLDGTFVLFIVLITLLPWAAVALLGWWLVRLALRRRRRSAATAEPAAGDAPA